MDSHSMTFIDDSIVELAYTELLISCQTEGCLSIFEPTLSDPATEAIASWAFKKAKQASELGWSVGDDGRVKCPIHRELTDKRCDF